MRSPREEDPFDEIDGVRRQCQSSFAMPDVDVFHDMLGEKGMEDYQERRITGINKRILQDVRGQRDPVCTLIAETRWGHFRLGRKDFAAETGLHPHAILNVEDAERRPERDTYASIIRYIEQRAYEIGGKAEKVLLATRNKLLNLLLTRDVGSDGGRQTVYAFYRELQYLVGAEFFEEETGITYGGLWQRRAQGWVPKFKELSDAIDVLKRRVVVRGEGEVADGEREKWASSQMVRAKKIWGPEKLRQLLSRGVPEPMAELYVALQCGGYRTTGPELHNRLLSRRRVEHRDDQRIPLRIAQAIASLDFESIRWSEIEPYIPDDILSRSDRWKLERSWIRAQSAVEQKDTFGEAFSRLRDMRGYTNNKIVRLLGITAKDHKPSAVLRRVLDDEAVTRKAPPAVLAHLVAREESEVQYMIDLWRERQRILLTRAGKHVSELKMDRGQWGVSLDELEKATPFMREDIIPVERGRRKPIPPTEEDLRSAIEALGMAKVQAALKHLSLYSEPLTVQAAVAFLAEDARGYMALHRQVKEYRYPDESPESGQHMLFSPAALKRMAAGVEVPPLPLLRRMLEAQHTAVTPALHRDWQLRYPEYLQRHGLPRVGRIRQPLVRSLLTVIAEVEMNMKQFCLHRLEGNEGDALSPSLLTREMKQVGKGEKLAWRRIERILLGADTKPDSPRWRFVQHLWNQDGDVDTALWDWQKDVGKNVLREPEHLPGLTESEIWPEVQASKRKLG